MIQYIRNKYIKTARRYFAICIRVLHAHFMHNRRVHQFQKQKHKIKFLIIAVIWMKYHYFKVDFCFGWFVRSSPTINKKKNCQSSCDCFNLLSVFANLKPQLKFWYLPASWLLLISKISCAKYKYKISRDQVINERKKPKQFKEEKKQKPDIDVANCKHKLKSIRWAVYFRCWPWYLTSVYKKSENVYTNLSNVWCCF